jgi:hypothetical protein
MASKQDRIDSLVSEIYELKRDLHNAQCTLGDLRDLVSDVVIDVETGREPYCLTELATKYRQIWPKAD